MYIATILMDVTEDLNNYEHAINNIFSKIPRNFEAND